MTSVAIEQNVLPAATRPGLRDLYRILLLRKNGSEFLASGDRPPFTLPCVEIPRWERVAENLTAALRKRYAISAICLFSPDFSASATNCEQPLYQVMEASEKNCPAPEDTCWFPADSFSDRSFADPQDSAAVIHALQQIRQFQSEKTRGPFGKPGWIEELLSWVEPEIDPYGLRLTGELRQLNASPTFTLVRLATNGPAVWFKAVGEPNLREFPISVTLSTLFPGFVPTVLASRPDWNGWLTTEFAGTTLDEVSDARAWGRAAETLARLQIESSGKSEQLLKAECRDLRVPTLLTLVDPFLDAMSRLMKEQPKTPPPVLNRDELQALGGQIKQALSDLAELDGPDALGHLDFNPGNILCSADQCVFLDWAEAYVGPPFLTFQYLLEHLSQATVQRLIGSQQIAEHYFSGWLCRASRAAVDAAQRLTPLLAVFACAVASDWTEILHSKDARFAGYLRSLTRRMQREAGALVANRRHAGVGVLG